MLDELSEGLVSLGLLLDLSWVRILTLQILSKLWISFHAEKYVYELTIAILPLWLILTCLDPIYFFEQIHEKELKLF